MKKSFHFHTRKLHRYLGLILGFQFLFWTIGGFYFSWSDMDEIHGDHQRKATSMIPVTSSVVSPVLVWNNIQKVRPIDSIVSVSLIQVLGKPVYQVICQERGGHRGKTYLANAQTGELRDPLTQTEAIQVAQMHFRGDAAVEKVEYLTTAHTHHEYRNQPLPAYAVTFHHPTHTTVYIASELGTVQKFRNTKWRVFDFLWMLHTMDYQSRDNISNWVLRLFSVFGLLTIFSGFLLYWVSSKPLHKLKWT